MAPENELKLLVKAYNELLEVRRNAIGFLTSEKCVDTQSMMENLSRQYGNLALDTRLGKSSIRNTYIKLFKRGFHYSVQATLKRVKILKEDYINQTNRRSRYGIIAPVAFCDEADIPRHLGNFMPACNLEQTWQVDFQQHCVESTNMGLLEVIGVSLNELMHWWTGSESDAVREETRVWRDFKNLALKLVDLFDKINRGGSRSSSEIDNGEPQYGLRHIIPQLKKVGQNLIRLLYIRQDNVRDILPLFEMLVPVVYACEMTLSFSTEDWKDFGSRVTSFLEAYTRSLSDQRDALIMQLGAVEEMNSYDRGDSCITTTTQRYVCESGAGSPDPKQKEDIVSLRREAVEALKKIGLCEKHIIITQRESIGDGSFAMVLKCREEHGHQELAVKYLKQKPNDPKRVKNRLLREAMIWSKLQDDKFSRLLGFCVSPDQELPGLISPFCEWTLATYLKAHESTASHSEKLCYIYDIACGLSHMHKHKDKIAHGDLRPPNVLLVPEQFGNGYNAVLSDFGVSYADEDIAGFDLTTLQHTNYLYLAPELLSKESGKERMVTTQGDVYSFGCVFLEVMYNLIPFYNHVSSVSRLRKDKKSGKLLPAEEKDISKQHWEFLKETWDPRPQNRPFADDVVFKLHKFKLM